MREFFKDQRPFSQRWVERVLTVAAAHLLKTYAILLDRSDPPLRLLKNALPDSLVPCDEDPSMRELDATKRSDKLQKKPIPSYSHLLVSLDCRFHISATF